jgi:hypothetical protein
LAAAQPKNLCSIPRLISRSEDGVKCGSCLLLHTPIQSCSRREDALDTKAVAGYKLLREPCSRHMATGAEQATRSGLGAYAANLCKTILGAADDIVMGYSTVSSSAVLNTGDAHPVFVLGAAALIKTGEVCNREVRWAANKVHKTAVIGRRTGGAVVRVGAHGVRHTGKAAVQAVKGAVMVTRNGLKAGIIVTRNALKAGVLVSRHAVVASSRATLALARRSGR